MPSWPDPGTRVTVRYRRPAGSVPPLTDVVGALLAVDPRVRVQTKTGAVVDIAPADVVAVRSLTDTPLRTSQIRAVEHAAALGWPGAEHHWLDGWLLRAGHGITHEANSAVPLGMSAQLGSIPAIADWYAQRGLTPLLACPDRLVRMPAHVRPRHRHRVLVRDVTVDDPAGTPDPQVTVTTHPDDAWLRLHGRRVPPDVLSAVVGGEVVFGTHAGGAIARATVTDAPDGTRRVGLWAVRTVDRSRPADHARALCATLLAWGAHRGATAAYVRVGADDGAAADLVDFFASLGFRRHHRGGYLPAAALDPRNGAGV